MTASTFPLRTGKSTAPHEVPAIACLGDSISWYNTDTATANQDSYNARGYLTQAVQLMRGRVCFPLAYNFGVSGETSAQILARVDSVIAVRPGYCVVMAGANDFNTTPALTFAAITGNLSAIYTKLTAAGIKVIAMCCTARAAWSALSAGEIVIARKMQSRVNRWIINQAQEYSRGEFYVCRSDISIADNGSATANPLTGTTSDNLHPIGLGAFYIAKYPQGACPYDILDYALPPRRQDFLRTDVYDAADNPTGSLITNPMPLGTTGTAGTGATGNVATGMTISRTVGATLTATVAKVAATDDAGVAIPQGGEYQSIVLGYTGVGAATETMRVRLSVGASGTTYAAGDELEATIDIEQTSLVNVLAIILAVNDFDGATNYLHYGNSASGVGADREPANAKRLIMAPRFTVRAYAGSGTQAVNFDLLINCICSGTAPSGTILIKNVSLRKV